MPTTTKPKRVTKREQERNEARERLLSFLRPGDTVLTILRHRARSGMARDVSMLVAGEDRELFALTYNAAVLLGERTRNVNGHDAIRVGGCGFDAGFDLVYRLAHALWPDGFECVGAGCPSNDHSNGDRDYTPHMHREAGYALRHRWV